MFFMKEKKNYGSEGKISIFYENIKKNVFSGYSCKNVKQNIFAYFSISENSATFSLFQQKNLSWLRPGDYWSVTWGWKNGDDEVPIKWRICFFDAFP